MALFGLFATVVPLFLVLLYHRRTKDEDGENLRFRVQGVLFLGLGAMLAFAGGGYSIWAEGYVSLYLSIFLFAVGGAAILFLLPSTALTVGAWMRTKISFSLALAVVLGAFLMALGIVSPDSNEIDTVCKAAYAPLMCDESGMPLTFIILSALWMNAVTFAVLYAKMDRPLAHLFKSS